jgi:hypothetical protein
MNTADFFENSSLVRVSDVTFVSVSREGRRERQPNRGATYTFHTRPTLEQREGELGHRIRDTHSKRVDAKACQRVAAEACQPVFHFEMRHPSSLVTIVFFID